MRKLYRVNIMRMGDSYSFNYAGKSKVYRGGEEGLRTLLRKLGASDDKVDPKSFRSKTFIKMAQEIVDQSDPIVWIWSNMLDKMNMIVTEGTQKWNIHLGPQINFDYMTKVSVFINNKEYNYEIDKSTWYDAKQLFNKKQYNKFINKMKPFLV